MIKVDSSVAGRFRYHVSFPIAFEDEGVGEMVGLFENSHRSGVLAFLIHLDHSDVSFVGGVEKFLDEDIVFPVSLYDMRVSPETVFWRQYAAVPPHAPDEFITEAKLEEPLMKVKAVRNRGAYFLPKFLTQQGGIAGVRGLDEKAV